MECKICGRELEEAEKSTGLCDSCHAETVDVVYYRAMLAGRY